MASSAANLAQKLADLDRRLQQVERGSRLSNASMHGEPLLVYSPEDPEVIRQVIGTQPDGSVTVVDTNGPPPPVPSAPAVEARPGTLVVTWDGTFVGGGPAPADWDHIEVHVSTAAGYAPTDATEVITLHSLKGGSVTLALAPVAHYVRLQAVNTSRAESAPTTEIAATPLPASTTGGIKTYRENDPPVGLGAADDGALWYDTNDSNHPYRWDGTTLAWVSIRDATIAAAASAASTAQTQANSALTAAQAAQATADGTIRTYYTAVAPTGLNNTSDVGDLWFNTTDQSAHRWSGTAWVLIQDTSIATALAAAQNAQITADGKITAYYQISPPTVGEVGDLWYDTDDKNRPYFCSTASTPGPVVWTAIRDGTIADAQATANTALGAATTDGLAPTSSPACEMIGGQGAILFRWTPITNPNRVTYNVYASTTPGFVAGPTNLVGQTMASQLTMRNLNGGGALAYGTTYYGKVIATDADGAGPVGAETFAQMVQINSPDISVAYVYAGQVIVDQLIGGNLAADVIMGATLRTALNGQRVEIGPLGILTYDSSGIPQTQLPTSGANIFKGLIEAAGITATGPITMRDTGNELTRGAAWTLNTGITASKATPSVIVDWETFNLDTATAFPTVSAANLNASHAICMCAFGTRFLVGFKSNTHWGWATFNNDGTFYAAGPQFLDTSSNNFNQIACKNTTAPVIYQDVRNWTRVPWVGSRTFYDDFSGGTFALWNSTSNAAVVSGVARITTSAVGTGSMIGPLNRSMNEKTLTAKITPRFASPGVLANQTWSFRAQQDISDYFEIALNPSGVAAGNLRFRYTLNAVNNDTVLAHDPVNYQYFRIEHAGTLINFYTSPDGVTWTNRKSITNGFTQPQLDAMHTEIQVSANGTALELDFDNVEINWSKRTKVNTSSDPEIPGMGVSDGVIWVGEMNAATPPAFTVDELAQDALTLVGTPVVTQGNAGFKGNVSGVFFGLDTNTPSWGASKKIVLASKSGGIHYWVFDFSTTNYEPLESFGVPTGGSRGLVYDGTQFWSLNASGQLAKHTMDTWNSTGDPETWWAAFSWYDSNTTAGSLTHETQMSAQASFAMHKRARYTITSPAIPTGLGTTDEIDSVRFYIGRGSTAPARTAMWLQGTSGVGVNSMLFTTSAFSGTNPPAVNGFVAGTSYAKIRNSDDTLVIGGDGSILAASVTTSALVVSTDDPWHTVGAAGEPAFANGWVANAGFAAQFRKDIAGNVHIRGTVQSGTFGATVFTLPVGYRPLTISSVNYLAPNANPATATPLVSITTSTGALSISQRTGVATLVAINVVFPTK